MIVDLFRAHRLKGAMQYVILKMCDVRDELTRIQRGRS